MEKYVATVPSRDEVRRCKHCGSRRLGGAGIRKNKSGDVQVLRCWECGKRFSANIGFRYRRYPKEVITGALQMYYSGMSARAVSEFYETKGIKVSGSAVYRWVQRYSRVASTFMDSITPQTGKTFRADEVWVNVEGQKKYLFASMDDETRFWLAFDLADTKHTHKAEKLFQYTADQAGKLPDTMITDGLSAYKQASRDVFAGMTRHVSEIHITGFKKGKDNNNKMERLNGTIRDREKTFRGLGTRFTANFHGLRIHYNHVRKHGAVGRRTPGEAAGINIEGADKWRTMIQNGSLHLIQTNQRV